MEQVNTAEKQNFVVRIYKIYMMIVKGHLPTQLLEKLVVKLASPRAITILIGVSIVTLFLSIVHTIIIIVSYAVVYFVFKQIVERRRFLQKYATTRNLEYAEILKKEDLTGRLFKRVHARYDNAFIFGTYANFPVKILYYSYSIGKRKHSMIYNFTVTELTVGQAMFPYILLQKKNMRKHQDADVLGDEKEAQVNLASLSETYSLYTTRGYEIEALQICIPEFVDLFQNSPLSLSVEFAGNHIYIYTEGELTTEKELDELYRVTKVVVDTFGNFLLRMRDDYQVLHEVYKKEKQVSG